MDKIKNFVQILILGLIPILVCAFVLLKEYKFLIVPFLAIFAMVHILPLSKHRECLWVFVLTFSSSLPLTIKLLMVLFYIFSNEVGKLYGCTYAMLLSSCFISIICILTTLLARILWRKQIKIFHV